MGQTSCNPAASFGCDPGELNWYVVVKFLENNIPITFWSNQLITFDKDLQTDNNGQCYFQSVGTSVNRGQLEVM